MKKTGAKGQTPRALPLPAAESRTAPGTEVDLRTLVDSLRQIAWLADADARPFHFNAWWLEYTQMTATQCQNFGWHALVHPMDLRTWMDRWAACVKTGEAFVTEFRLKRTADHLYRWHLAQCTPVSTPGERISGWIGILTDIHERKLAADELRHTRELFEYFAKEVHDQAVVVIDPEGHVTEWNAGAERMTGYSAKEIVGKHFALIFSVQDIAEGKPGRELKEAGLKGRIVQEGQAARKDGSTFYARITTTSLREATGELRGFARVMHDLTHLKGAEAGLQLYIELWDNLPIGLLLLHIDMEEADETVTFNILAANRAVLEVVRKEGFVVEDLLNMSLFEALPNLLEQEVTTSLLQVMDSSEPCSLGEMRLRDEQRGDEVFAIQAFPLPNQCLGLVFEKITDRKRAEDALRASEARFKAVLECAPDAMVITDHEGRMTLVNRQTELLFGYRREELIGKPVEILVPDRLQNKHVPERKAFALEGRARVMGSGLQLYGRRKDGSEFPADISLSPLQTGGGFCFCTAIRLSRPHPTETSSGSTSATSSPLGVTPKSTPPSLA